MADLSDVMRELGRVGAAVESVKENQERIEKRLVERDDDHEKRLGSLERSRSRVWGAMGAGGFFATSIGAIITYFKNGGQT